MVKAALGEDARPIAVPEAIDWSSFLAAVERHRVGAFLHQRIAPQIASSCPIEVTAKFRSIATTTTRRSLMNAAEQIRLSAALNQAEVDVLGVKGLVLAQQRYGALGMRHSGDIDLFVRGSDVARADATLVSTGLRRTRPDFALTPLQWKKYLRLKPEFEYVRETTGARIELLWRLDGIDDSTDIWEHTGECSIGGRRVRTLPSEIEAFYLLQHGARHGWFRLFWLVDAALVLRDPTLDWASMMSRARAAKTERPLLQAAALAHSLFGITPPAALTASKSERRILGRLVAEATRQITREPASHEGVGEWARQLRYRVLLQRKTRYKFATLAPHLFTPETWRMWPLPDRWFVLYYIAAPFLWLGRRIARRG